jgi:hypothetical protein
MVQIRREMGQRWSAGIPLVYNYIHQVLDASITETNLTALPVRGHMLDAAPSVRFGLGQEWELEGEFAVQRQLFGSDELDDYWEGGPRLTLRQNYAAKSFVALSGMIHRRDYDTRTQFSAAGEAVPGTRLEYLFTRLELAWQHAWDARQRWRTVTRLGVEVNRDNGSGYFDYDRFMVAEQVRFRAGPWEGRAQAKLLFYHYRLQIADPPESGLRERAAIACGAGLERSLGKHFKLVADYEYEATLSNLAMDEYRVNVFSGGVEWSY